MLKMHQNFGHIEVIDSIGIVVLHDKGAEMLY